MSRRGMSLLELVVALTLTGIVALLVWSILQSAAGRLRDRSERFGMEHSLRVASGAARSLLESLGTDSAAGPDLALPAPDGFVARAVRANGVLCDAGPSSLLVRSGPGWWVELRGPVAGRDSVAVGTVSGPDRWVVASLAAAPGAGWCPDGTPARLLAMSLAPADLATVGPGSPLRVFEPIKLLAYSSSGAQWVGMVSMTSGGSIQPLAGPFVGVGLQFSYFSLAGAPTSLAGAIARADLDITGLTEHAGGVGIARISLSRTDSLSSSTLLRNAP